MQKKKENHNKYNKKLILFLSSSSNKLELIPRSHYTLEQSGLC